MKYYLLVLSIFIYSDSYSQNKPLDIISKGNYSIPVYDYNGLEKILHTKSDTTYVINFWATWCAPCVEELPYFIKLDSAYSSKKIKVILVSLDMRTKIEGQLIPFLEIRNIKTKVVVLSDNDMNVWIPKLNKDWEGSIPATLIFNKTKNEFYPYPFSYEELINTINNFKN
jgi:thiol-disulfide isomerase/thioredoxin